MARSSKGVDTRLAKALSHPVRVNALKILNDRVASPSEIARELELPVANVSYHIKTLLQLGCIEEVEYRHVRGAVEHRYRALRRPEAQLDDWADMPANAREDLAGKVARAAYQDLRAAHEDGTLAACDRPVYAWTRVHLDQQGWDEVYAILEDAIDQALKVAESSAARIEAGERGGTRAALSVFLHPLAAEAPPAPDAHGPTG
jgi:DNA-binding transcriptional ArsR family regulator